MTIKLILERKSGTKGFSNARRNQFDYAVKRASEFAKYHAKPNTNEEEEEEEKEKYG
ncbi:hypothetical protein [Obesumbacterium proteus]|uniref:hypothetical protein n=1 Tax=Obesumbacterium proteus TaxID=82983 RepID=UPI0012DEF471|nr:hypothetical protein [Obesumbacterium proteus]